MSDTTFSLVPVWQIIWAWRKRIVVFVAVVSIASAVAVFFLPKYYLSAVLAVPGNPYLADKGHLFNSNIQGLYSPYGSGDELERLNGIAELDTVYKTVIKEFGIVDYYKLPANEPEKSMYKAIKALREDLRIQQTDKGQLKILMWHEDPQKAAAIVNRVASITQQIAMDMQVQYNQQSLTNIDSEIVRLRNYIQVSSNSEVMERQGQKLASYNNIAEEIKLAIANNPKALIIQEQGYASGKEDKPKKLPIVAAAFFLSLLFAVLTALLYNRKNNHASAV